MERTYIAIDDLAMTTSRDGAITGPNALVHENLPARVAPARMRLLFRALPV
jgi:hypothetical protein